MKRNYWYVIETCCYPNSWKVVNDYYQQDNNGNFYFSSCELANKEANERNFLETNKLETKKE